MIGPQSAARKLVEFQIRPRKKWNKYRGSDDDDADDVDYDGQFLREEKFASTVIRKLKPLQVSAIFGAAITMTDRSGFDWEGWVDIRERYRHCIRVRNGGDDDDGDDLRGIDFGIF